MDRQKAYQLLTKYLHNKNLIKHCLATEAAMRAIYRHLTPKEKQTVKQEEIWGITGLLHDIDYEIAQKENMLDKHGLLIFEKEPGAIPEPIAHAIKAHNFEHTGVQPENAMDWAIANVDSLTGLIVACALIHPERKLSSIDTDFIMKRFNEKAFAKGARRTSIKLCEETLSIPLEKFIAITLKAMQEIHEQLGL
jgi:predicted hydrolase (HD superfamily)